MTAASFRLHSLCNWLGQNCEDSFDNQFASARLIIFQFASAWLIILILPSALTDSLVGFVHISICFCRLIVVHKDVCDAFNTYLRRLHFIQGRRMGQIFQSFVFVHGGIRARYNQQDEITIFDAYGVYDFHRSDQS